MNTARLMLLASPLNPARLFSPTDMGAWYDPTDMSTTYQESIGFTPGAVDSVIGMLEDKRFALARGADLIANGGFDSDLSGWTVIDTAPGVTSVVAGVAQLSAVGGGAICRLRQPLTVTASRWYEATFTAGGDLSVSSQVNMGSTAGGSDYAAKAATAGANRALGFCTGTTLHFSAIKATANGIMTIDDISVREIAGSHAIQGTAGSRPTLRAGGKIDFASGTKSLVTTWGSALGSSCTVARAIQGVGASILTGQTIDTTYTDTTDHCGLVIINRALTDSETQKLTRYLNRKAGV